MKSTFKKTALVILFSLCFFVIKAQIPNGYYNNADNKIGDELKAALHEIINEHTILSYNQLWNAFWSTDNKGNGVVWDMYSDIPNGTPPYTFYLGQDQCGEYSGEGDCYNREHSWPQSWFGTDNTPTTDLHHIFPTDGFVNAERGNNPYGEVGSGATTYQNGSKLGNCKSSLGYSGKVFEPIDAYKGDFARAYFYMSVRYYTEDGSWGSSGMTNKSEILPWAMTMLLNWSDNDPVSQKEIDRNNVIYNDYQHNRNPFIDHPEYARMIWDPNWQGGTTYAITCATNLQHGSVSAPSSAMEGSTVAISATPEPGYMVDIYSVYQTGNPNNTVTVTSNGTFIMPDFAVTVSATFVQNNTLYQIALGSVSHGTIHADAQTALSGSVINLTATPDNGYSLYAWYVYKTGDMNTKVNVSGDSFVMPAYNVTVMASFIQGTVSNGDYEKVTSAPTDWSGEYLIVCSNNNVAFDGALSSLDATGNTIAVTISNNTIEANATTNASQFTIAPMTGGYSIMAASGKYIGNASNSNGLTSSDTPLANTLNFNSENVDLVGSGGAYLRYNASPGQERFRYFKSSTYTGQQAIQLFRKSEATPAPTHTIHFNNNGGTGSMDDQTVNEFESTALHANTFTKDGYAFEGWNTAADGTGDFYADGATINLFEDVTLYAQWYYSQEYQLVTSTDQLVAGRTYLIVNLAYEKALGTTQNNNNRSASDVTIENNVIHSIDNSVCELILGTTGNNWTFFDAGWGTNGGYLCAASSSSNYLRTQANNDANSQWSITFGDNGVATIKAQGSYSRNLLKYNNSSAIFSCYASGSTQLDVYLFRRTEITDYQAEQSFELAQGWNWWSTYLDITMEDLETALETNGKTIKDKGGNYNSYRPSGVWQNGIEEFHIEQMYKIQTNAECTITLSGTPFKPLEHPITIQPGANWIGFPLDHPVDISQAFASNFAPTINDIVKDKNGNYVTYRPNGWNGAFTFQPGQGYIYLSKASKNKTLFFSSGQNQ